MKYSLFIVCCALSAFAQTKPLFVEDFESGQIDPKVWEQRITGTATVKVQSDQTAHGKYALQVHYPEMAAQAYAFLVMPHLPEGLKGHIFGRAYVKVDPGFQNSHTVMVLAGQSGWPISNFQEIGVYQNKFQPSYQANKAKTRQEGRGEDTRHGDPPPVGKWFLLEWEFNDNPSQIRIWVDGQPSPVLEGGQPVEVSSFKWPKTDAGDTKNLVGGYDEFGVGARYWGNPQTAFDIYYDDIVLDTKRIGPVK